MDEGKLTYRDYARLARLELDEIEAQCRAEAFRAHGPGGQGVNTTDSAVRVTHVPTGVSAVSRQSRSQYRNRRLCLQKIRRIFEERSKAPRKRIATVPSAATKQARLDAKRRTGELKRSRRPPAQED